MAEENTIKTSTNTDGTTSRSVRFPNNLVEDIKAGIDDVNTDFSKVVVYRLRHYNRPLTCEIVVKIQNIVNHSLAAAKHGSTEPFRRIQMEVEDLWKYLKYGDMVFQEKYVELLLDYGYTCDEVEDMLTDHSLLQEAIKDVKYMCNEKLYEECYGGAF